MAYTTINKPSDYFNTVLYTGNGSTNNITGVNFQPDMVILKSRSNATNHQVYDVIRGATKKIITNGNNAEGTEVNGLQSFDSDGFTLSSEYDVNNSSATYASWNWKADGTSGSSNTDGSITSTVSANTTSGFSVVTYAGNSTSGATIGHGLGATPKMIIIKNRDTTDSWNVYHSSIGNTGRIFLDTTGTVNTTATAWNNTSPTSSVFTVGNNTGVNSSNLVAYCFAEKKGFSKFGSYTGNGSTDGTFIYTGFKPAFFMWKASSTTGAWYTIDNKRSDYNPADKLLGPNDSATESAFGYNYDHDFLSNGIKTRYGSFDMNQSGVTYIYMAFAEFPTVSSTGTPVTAR